MTVECPYCREEKKPRGLKNHVRLASGDGHGDPQHMPDDFDERIQVDDGENDADAAADGDDVSVTMIEPSELEAVHEGAERDSGESDDGDDLPFDPSDSDAIRLDGGETLDIRTDSGQVAPGVRADEGDYLLKTDDGPVLYDADDGEMYEVVTV